MTAAGAWNWHFTSHAEVKNKWATTSTPPCIIKSQQEHTGCCTASWMSVNIHHSNKSLRVTSNCSWVLPFMQLADNSLRCSCVHRHGWWGTNVGTCSSNGHRFHQWAWSRQRSGDHGNDSILVVLERLLLYCCQLWHKSEQLHRYYHPQYSKMLSSLNGDLATVWFSIITLMNHHLKI